jgi:hypothetical protein
MGNKHAGGRPSVGGSFATAILALPRRTKRLIMATTDAVAIPVAPSAVGARRMVELFTWDSIARRRLVDCAAAVQE